MKFNFKKVASVLASAAMLGSTIGLAAAASVYPDPFIKGGVANVAIVVGASAATIDNIAAVDVGANLQAELARQTATTTSVGATGVGGDSVNLATSSQKLYYGSATNAARTGISKSEMPTLLADGSIVDDAGTEYSFTQTLTPGNNTVGYSTSGGDLEDPALLVQVGTDANAYLYQLDISFNKNINITSSDVQGNNIKILGKDFTIGSGSNSGTPVLYLYGAGTEKTVSEGETANLEVGGKTYALEVKSVEQTGGVNYVSISVDGGSIRRITEGTSSKIGDIEVYAKSIHYLAKEAQVSYADLNIGSTKVKIGTSGTTVKTGTDETSIQGTKAYLTSTAAGGLSKISIKVAMAKSTTDHLAIGSTFEDPIFGNLQVKFADVAPALDSDMRDSVVIDTDNNRNAKVTFTPYLGSENGAKTIYFAHDQDSSESTITTLLADQSNKTVHVVENELVGDSEYMVVNAGDYGRILKVTELPTLLETTSKIQLEDVVTGKSLFEGGGLTVGTDGDANTNIDGNTYYFHVTGNSTATSYVQITWGAGAAENNAGSATTVFPRIKLAKGGWIALMNPTTVSLGTTYSLPGLQTLADYETGLVLFSANLTGEGSKTFGNVAYNISRVAATNGTTGIIQAANLSASSCDFSSASLNGAAVLLLEEKKVTETNNANNGDAICVNVDTSGTTTPVETSVSTPIISGTSSGLQSLTSDSNVRQAVTRYGTFVEYDSTDNDKVTIKYPDDQMYADILVAQSGVEVSSGGQGGSVATLGSVAVMDSEIATVSSKNLIVIGGSCINTVAAKMLGSDAPICGADFTTKAGISSGQFLIKALDSPYTTGKVAMLVAGYEGADTRKAATYLTSMKPSTAVGTDLKKQTATYEDVV